MWHCFLAASSATSSSVIPICFQCCMVKSIMSWERSHVNLSFAKRIRRKHIENQRTDEWSKWLQSHLNRRLSSGKSSSCEVPALAIWEPFQRPPSSFDLWSRLLRFHQHVKNLFKKTCPSNLSTGDPGKSPSQIKQQKDLVQINSHGQRKDCWAT